MKKTPKSNKKATRPSRTAAAEKVTKAPAAVSTTVREKSPERKVAFDQSRTAFYIVALIILLLGLFLFIPNNEAASLKDSAAAGQTGKTTFSYNGVEGKTALAILKATHDVETQNYDFGEFVTSIEGSTAGDGYFWSFYVNGQLAQQGADTYVTRDSDTITWKLEKVQ